jgi:hypothetical protein
MSGPVLTAKLHFGRQGKGRKQVKDGEASVATARGVPRVAKLMALAIRFEGLIRDGVVKDQAELARLGHVSRARISQIMGLLSLAPDIQEAILWLPAVERGRDPFTEKELRSIAEAPTWKHQRRLWLAVVRARDQTRVLE